MDSRSSLGFLLLVLFTVAISSIPAELLGSPQSIVHRENSAPSEPAPVFTPFETQDTPLIVVDPLDIQLDLAPGDTAVRPLTIENRGDADLEFTVELDIQPRLPPRDYYGGPDDFGYRWLDTTEDFGPDYDWIDISETGMALNLGNDQTSAPLELGWNFPWYGEVYSTIRICSNGWITFDEQYDHANIHLPEAPHTNHPNNLLLINNFNVDRGIGSMIRLWTDEDSIAVVSWIDVVHRHDRDVQTSFQAILNRSGRVVYQYGPQRNLDGSISNIGFENARGEDGLSIIYREEDRLYEGLAIEIKPPDPHEWIWLSDDSGTIRPGEDMQIDVYFSAAELTPGIYSASLDIRSNDPEHPRVAVAIQLDVPAPEPPELLVEPLEIETELEEGESAEFPINLLNDGEEVIVWRTSLDIIEAPLGDAGGNDRGRRVPLRDDIESRFAIFQNTPAWNVNLWQAVLDRVDDLDYERFTSDDFEDFPIDDFRVIWVVHNEQSAEYNAAYNENRERFEQWVDNGGVLLATTGTNQFEVRPVHPGGLTYTRDGTADGIVTVQGQDPDADDYNYLAELMEWEVGTVLHGELLFHVHYPLNDVAEIDNNDWNQVIARLDGRGNHPGIVVYNYGFGFCMVSGTTDGHQQRNYNRHPNWGAAGEELCIYLDYLARKNAWIRWDPSEGRLEEGSETDIIVSLDAAELRSGNYEADLHILSNDPDNEDIAVNIRLGVDLPEPPSITVEPVELASFLEVGESENHLLSISNTGERPLEFESELELDQNERGEFRGLNRASLRAATLEPNRDDPMDWVTWEPDAGVVAGGESTEMTVSIQSGELEPGRHEATLHILSNDEEHPDFGIEIMVVVTEPHGGERELNHFTDFSRTDVNHSILALDVRSVEDEPVSTGWEVGVFTPDDLLAGAGVWVENARLGFAAWGDDDQTGEIDGFRVDEEFLFRVWDNEEDREYIALFEVVEGDETWQTRGISVVELTVSMQRRLIVPLRVGWNLMSVNIRPGEDRYDEGERRGPSIIKMFEPYVEHLVLLKNSDGLFYAPRFDFLNIPFWDLAEGYWVKLDDPVNAAWQGEPIPAQTEIQVSEGWNQVAYYPEYPLSAEAPDYYVLSSIIDHVILAKGETGLFMLPRFDFSNMHSWREGEGYQLKVDEDVTLTYPEQQMAQRRRNDGHRELSPAPAIPAIWNGVKASPVNMSLLCRFPPTGKDLTGTVVAAIDLAGTPVGIGRVKLNGNCGIAVMGDVEDSDAREGLAREESFEIRYWDRNIDRPLPVKVDAVLVGKGLCFYADDFTVIEARTRNAIPDAYYLSSAHPNPFNAETMLYFGLPEQAHVQIQVFNPRGQRVAELVDEVLPAGRHEIIWTARKNGAGLYFIRMNANYKSYTSKIIQIK